MFPFKADLSTLLMQCPLMGSDPTILMTAFGRKADIAPSIRDLA